VPSLFSFSFISQTDFDPRNNPTSPKTVATAPPTNIHIDLSVAEPVKNREMSELDELYALIPNIRRRTPPTRIASEIALFIDKPSARFFMFSFTKKSHSFSSADHSHQNNHDGDNEKNVN
jgi:hypothetical protein